MCHGALYKPFYLYREWKSINLSHNILWLISVKMLNFF